MKQFRNVKPGGNSQMVKLNIYKMSLTKTNFSAALSPSRLRMAEKLRKGVYISLIFSDNISLQIYAQT